MATIQLPASNDNIVVLASKILRNQAGANSYVKGDSLHRIFQKILCNMDCLPVPSTQTQRDYLRRMLTCQANVIEGICDAPPGPYFSLNDVAITALNPSDVYNGANLIDRTFRITNNHPTASFKPFLAQGSRVNNIPSLWNLSTDPLSFSTYRSLLIQNGALTPFQVLSGAWQTAVAAGGFVDLSINWGRPDISGGDIPIDGDWTLTQLGFLVFGPLFTSQQIQLFPVGDDGTDFTVQYYRLNIPVADQVTSTITGTWRYDP